MAVVVVDHTHLLLFGPPGSARESGGTGGVGNSGEGSAGTTNRGGGGGGSGGSPNAGGAGGKGVCIIKFSYLPTFNFTAMDASGGNATYTNGDYKIHVFTSPGTFTVNTVGSTGEVEYVIVGGGGGGGGNHAGGGGVGGFLTGMSTLTAQGYPISIGAGGAGTPDNGVPGTQGGPSTFNSITAQGGGAGSGDSNPSTILNGGSGGGGHRNGSPTYGLGNYVANGSSTATVTIKEILVALLMQHQLVLQMRLVVEVVVVPAQEEKPPTHLAFQEE